jgi:hypothetical protein|tara:strand:+ start:156 stop:779 length:624 start_codon:yes stop_codon:yes gene_type:complete
MEQRTSRNTIGFFGDSFCAESTNTSWTTLLADKLQADIVNVGRGGSSIWTAILDFLDTNNIPDYLIFCWTNPRRLYHPTKIATPRNIEKSNFGDAAERHFAYLWNERKENLNYKWTLEHFDQSVLSKIKEKTKIIQVFSFTPEDVNSKHFDVALKTGEIIKESLTQFSGYDFKNQLTHNGTDEKLNNHMSIQKNQELADYLYSKCIH